MDLSLMSHMPRMPFLIINEVMNQEVQVLSIERTPKRRDWLPRQKREPVSNHNESYKIHREDSNSKRDPRNPRIMIRMMTIFPVTFTSLVQGYSLHAAETQS